MRDTRQGRNATGSSALPRAAVLAALLWLSACSHTPPAKPTGLTADAFFKDQGARREQTEVISAKLKLRYQARDERVAGKGRLLAQRPSQLRIELRDPLGRVQYVVALDGKRFQAFVPSQKRMYVDEAAGEAYLKRFLGLDLSFRALQNLFVGVLPDALSPKSFSSWSWDEGRGVYRAQAVQNGATLTLEIDPGSAAVKTIVWERPTDTVKVTYGDYGDCCGDGKGIRLAYAVEVKLEKAGSLVEVEWDDIQKSTERRQAESFRIVAPDGTKTITLP